MPNAVVLGAGMVGSVMAADLASDFEVVIADANPAALERAVARTGGRATKVIADLSDPQQVRDVVASADIVLGALASRVGFGVLRAVIEAGKNYVDISFMPENALQLDALAKEHGVTAVVDCGVAPGMSNLLSAHSASRMDRCDSIEIYVGGLPVERRWPFEYKAGFAPSDVIEEYTRPARYVVDGEIVVKEALSEPELMDFEGVGTLEAFNTDGLRSLVDTLNVLDMKEKTLRYPGHIELMRVFRETGLFDQEPIEVPSGGGLVAVKPLDVISKLMFPKWTYEDDEADLTVMRITVEGETDGTGVRHTWDVLDYLDPDTGFTSMSRTTAFPCAIVARLVAAGELDTVGVLPPELFAKDRHIVDHILSELAGRNVDYRFTESMV
jgi:lysine 6-dehydrogenase